METGGDGQARTHVDVQAQTRGFEHHRIGHAHQANFVDRGLTRNVDAKLHARHADDGLCSHHQTKVQVDDGQAHSIGVGLVTGDTAITVLVIEVAAGLAIDKTGNPDEGVAVADANGQCGDGGLLAVGERDHFAAALGEGHRGRHLQKARQVDFGVTHLGLNDLAVEVQEHHVVATRRQGKTGGINDAVLVAVLARVQDAIVVHIFGEVLERLAVLEVNERWAHHLQHSIYIAHAHHESVDVDLDVLHLGRQQRWVNAHQGRILDVRFG